MPCCPRVRAGLRVAKPVLVHTHGHGSMIGPDPVPRTRVTAFFCTDTVTRENLEADYVGETLADLEFKKMKYMEK